MEKVIHAKKQLPNVQIGQKDFCQCKVLFDMHIKRKLAAAISPEIIYFIFVLWFKDALWCSGYHLWFQYIL